jgi:hypothetical protein
LAWGFYLLTLHGTVFILCVCRFNKLTQVLKVYLQNHIDRIGRTWGRLEGLEPLRDLWITNGLRNSIKIRLQKRIFTVIFAVLNPLFLTFSISISVPTSSIPLLSVGSVQDHIWAGGSSTVTSVAMSTMGDPNTTFRMKVTP